MPKQVINKLIQMKPLCFVIMPFGKKKDTDGKEIDFDEIYNSLIHPAIIMAGMEPMRAPKKKRLLKTPTPRC